MIKAPDQPRAITLDPLEAILHVSTEPGENHLYPNAIRFRVNEAREGLSWESSDPGVAAADPDGTVRAVAAGTMVLTVRLKGAAAATATVAVKAGGRADVVLR